MLRNLNPDYQEIHFTPVDIDVAPQRLSSRKKFKG